QGGGPASAQAHGFGMHDVKIDGTRKADGFGQPCFRRSARLRAVAENRGEHKRPPRFCRGQTCGSVVWWLVRVPGTPQIYASSASFAGSKSWIGPAGMMVEMACL